MARRALYLCNFSDLTEGQARGFDPHATGEDTVIVVKDGIHVRVFQNLCPHERRPMAWRKDKFLSPDGRALMCYAHGARFDKVSGLCFAGPCVGLSLWSLPCEISPGGEIYVFDGPETVKPS